MKSVLFLAFLVPAVIHAVGLEGGVDVGYFNPKLTARTYPGLTAAQATNFMGPLYTAYGHLTLPLPHTTLGFGLTFSYSNQITNDTSATVTKEDLSMTRFGGDIKLQLDVLQVVLPYIRVNFGKDNLSWTDRGTVPAGSYIASSTAGGLFYSVLLGVQIPFVPEFALYAQGGFTESPGSVLVTRSYAVNGTNQAVSSSSASDTTYSGLIFSGGARLSF